MMELQDYVFGKALRVIQKRSLFYICLHTNNLLSFQHSEYFMCCLISLCVSFASNDPSYMAMTFFHISFAVVYCLILLISCSDRVVCSITCFAFMSTATSSFCFIVNQDKGNILLLLLSRRKSYPSFMAIAILM